MPNFDGNGNFEDSLIITSSIGSCIISNCTIGTSILDMNNKPITSVLDPVFPQEASTKAYVDSLQIVFNTITLTGTSSSLISPIISGCVDIKVKNLILNGPSAIFSIIKNEPNTDVLVQRLNLAPGISDNCSLKITWPISSGIYLNKTLGSYDGSYKIKMDFL